MTILIPDILPIDLRGKFPNAYTDGNYINLFGSSSALTDTKGNISEYEMQMEFRLINALERFQENANALYVYLKENEIVLNVPFNVIEKYSAVLLFYMEMNKLIHWLDDSYSRPLKTAYLHDKLLRAFSMLEVIMHSAETGQKLK